MCATHESIDLCFNIVQFAYVLSGSFWKILIVGNLTNWITIGASIVCMIGLNSFGIGKAHMTLLIRMYCIFQGDLIDETAEFNALTSVLLTHIIIHVSSLRIMSTVWWLILVTVHYPTYREWCCLFLYICLSLFETVTWPVSSEGSAHNLYALIY